MRVDLVTADGLDDLGACWAQLITSGDEPFSPFLRPEVVRAAAVLPGVEVAMVSDGGHLVAVLPFERQGRRARAVGAAVNEGDGIVCRPGAARREPAG